MKKIIITGASSGIGLSCVKQCLAAGYQVLGISRSKPAIENNHFTWLACDLSKQSEVASICRAILNNHPYAGLIYCAGVGHFGCLEQLSAKDFSSDMQVNCLSAMEITKAILPDMKKEKYGFLIYIGSEAAIKGAKQGSLYCATKFALRGFVQSLAEEVRSDHIRVTLINPGSVATSFHDECHFAPAKEPDCNIDLTLIASQIMALVEQDHLGFISELEIKPFKHCLVKKT